MWTVQPIGSAWFAWPADTALARTALERGTLFGWSGQAWLRVLPAPTSAPTTPTELTYPIHPDGCYGSTWRDTRPPWLPATDRWGRPVRCCSARDAAAETIRQLADAKGLGDGFTRVVLHLARNESGAEWGKPAHSETTPSWGCFQFLPSAWDSLSEPKSYIAAEVNGPALPSAAGQDPWDATPIEELAGPVNRYAQIYYTGTQLPGGGHVSGARSVRLWHSGRLYLTAFFDLARERGDAESAYWDAGDTLQHLLRHGGPETYGDRYDANVVSDDEEMRAHGVY